MTLKCCGRIIITDCLFKIVNHVFDVFLEAEQIELVFIDHVLSGRLLTPNRSVHVRMVEFKHLWKNVISQNYRICEPILY